MREGWSCSSSWACTQGQTYAYVACTFFGLCPAGLRLDFQVAGLGQELGARLRAWLRREMCISARSHPATQRRPEETLESQPKDRFVVPVAGNGVTFEESEGRRTAACSSLHTRRR
jgi:hypothetical protein